MALKIVPDPGRPHGGYARILLPASDIEGDAVTVSVFNAFNEKYLGADGFQSDSAAFGPYPVERGSNQTWLTIGPEIVNRIDENTPLRITVGERVYELAWPDQVVPAFGAAKRGGLAPPGTPAVSAGEPVFSAKVMGRERLPGANEDRGPDISLPSASADRRSSIPIFVGGALLVIFALAGALYGLSVFGWAHFSDSGSPELAAVASQADAPSMCAGARIAEMRRQPFTRIEASLRNCANEIEAETALGFLEDGASAGDPKALLIFGKTYDIAVLDESFEDAMGLSFPDSPGSAALAAEYYARAQEAGSAEAAGLLAAICARLSVVEDTRSRSVYLDYCPQ